MSYRIINDIEEELHKRECIPADNNIMQISLLFIK